MRTPAATTTELPGMTVPITATDSNNAAAKTTASASAGCPERKSISACTGKQGRGVGPAQDGERILAPKKGAARIERAAQPVAADACQSLERLARPASRLEPQIPLKRVNRSRVVRKWPDSRPWLVLEARNALGASTGTETMTQLLRRPEAAARLSIGASMLRKLCASDATFPRPIKLAATISIEESSLPSDLNGIPCSRRNRSVRVERERTPFHAGDPLAPSASEITAHRGNAFATIGAMAARRASRRRQARARHLPRHVVAFFRGLQVR